MMDNGLEGQGSNPSRAKTYSQQCPDQTLFAGVRSPCCKDDNHNKAQDSLSRNSAPPRVLITKKTSVA
jgi:hypothetical protein